MKKNILNKLFLSILLFSFGFNFSFIQANEVSQTDSRSAAEFAEDREVLNSLLSMFGGPDSDGKDAMNDFISGLQKALQERARVDAEKKFNLLPKELREMFLKEQRKFEDISISITFENCIVTLLNKIDVQLVEIQDSKIKKKAAKIREILQGIYYFVDNGFISFLISQGSLPGLYKKHEDLISSFYDYNQAPFFLPFTHDSRNKVQLSPKDKKIERFVTRKLKVFAYVLKRVKHNSLSIELKSLAGILEALSEKNLSKLIDTSLEYIQKEVDENYDGLTKVEKSFEYFNKRLSDPNHKEEFKKEITAIRHFSKEIKSFKKALEVFKSYKKDLKIQKGAWSQLFNNFLMVSYDLYGKVDPFSYIFKGSGDTTLIDPYRFKFNPFRLEIWKNKFFRKYAWPDRAVRTVTSLTTFFDYHMALKGMSLLEVMSGNGDLSSLGKDGISLLDVVLGEVDLNTFILNGVSKREFLMVMALFKAWYIYKVVNVFSKNLWPLESLLSYAAALTSYHFFGGATDVAKVFWPKNDERIKDATLLTLYRAKNSLADFAEVLLYITNPTLFENLENKTLGVLSPELIRLGLDLAYPDIVNHVPEGIANLKREGRFLSDYDINELGLSRNFIRKQPNYPESIKKLKDEINVLEKNKNRNEQESLELKEKKDFFNDGSTQAVIASNTFYNREEYYEGRVLGYLSSSVGGNIGKLVFESQGRRIGSYVLTGAKGIATLLDAITGRKANKSINEIEADFKETFKTFKEVLVALVASSGDHNIVGIFLYNLAGLGILSYSDAAKFYTDIKKDMGDLLHVSMHFEKLFDSILVHLWGKVGKVLGSRFAMWRTGILVDEYGPFYPKIKSSFI